MIQTIKDFLNKTYKVLLIIFFILAAIAAASISYFQTQNKVHPPQNAKASEVLPTSAPISRLSRPMKYYLVDRVRSNSDFAWLASKGINTAIVDFKVGPISSSPEVWDSIVNAATSAKVKIVIWPDGHDGKDVSGCRWETPFDDTSIGNGTDYLLNIRAILNRYGNNPNVIGIVTAHEPVWVAAADQDRCSETIADMTMIKLY
jgi:hypothetical protein